MFVPDFQDRSDPIGQRLEINTPYIKGQSHTGSTLNTEVIRSYTHTDLRRCPIITKGSETFRRKFFNSWKDIRSAHRTTNGWAKR
jgi:hypothetical protein